MSIGGVGSGRGGFGPEETQGPTGPAKPFQMPSNWQTQINEALSHIDPNNPSDVEAAAKILTQLSEDPSTPLPIQKTAREASQQLQSGFLVSKNPIELMEPYLSLCTISMPIGPGWGQFS